MYAKRAWKSALFSPNWWPRFPYLPPPILTLAPSLSVFDFFSSLDFHVQFFLNFTRSYTLVPKMVTSEIQRCLRSVFSALTSNNHECERPDGDHSINWTTKSPPNYGLLLINSLRPAFSRSKQSRRGELIARNIKGKPIDDNSFSISHETVKNYRCLLWFGLVKKTNEPNTSSRGK